MFECVINISEGRDSARIAAFEHCAGASLRDRHSDVDHHRSVFTLINTPRELESDVRALIGECVATLDLRHHEGVHPRLGVVDVVPFVALKSEQSEVALGLRDRTAQWMGEDLAVPCFLYGPIAGDGSRTLPGVRRQAFRGLLPDVGPTTPHPSAGASALGARDVLVAWNLWLEGADLATARSIATTLRGPAVRALGLKVTGGTQVSCNLIDVSAVRPSEIYDRVSELLPRSARIARAELVGLAPRTLLDREDQRRWLELGLSPLATIESQLGR